MRVLVTGGAGYIGSHAVRLLAEVGHQVVVLDNLSTGHAAAIDARATFVEASLTDHRAVCRALEGCDAVLHFAARSIVSESCSEPLQYWSNNVGGSIALLQAMEEVGVGRLIFSSTAATYGIPSEMPIVETTTQAPINPYGATKLAVEAMIRDHHAARPDFGFAILRYFNVAGCGPGLGEDHNPETHLVPILLEAAAGRRSHISIFGTDYPTPDGSCIRDYVHVEDLVEAHRVVLEALRPGDARVYNIGSGTGCSVREMVGAAREVTGIPFEAREGARRAGDPPVLVTDPTRILEELGWRTSRSDIAQILADHWRWARSNPNGWET